MPQPTRTEKDSMGEMQVPVDALYGASTARAVENFPVSHRPVPAAVIHAFGHLKAACAQANLDLGKLLPEIAQVIIDASNEVAEGKHDAHFPVDIYQTGSGTSTNMNANEVIANLATQRLKQRDSNAKKVHPNDHVNMGQSSNDTFPTAMRIAGVLMIEKSLHPSLIRLAEALEQKAIDWDSIIKIGRTHLMDATPIRVGQVFSGYAAQAKSAVQRSELALAELCTDLPIGGTAVGTGINTHPEFGRRVCETLNKRLGIAEIPFHEARNHPEAQATQDNLVEASALLKVIAVSLTKIANDIRWLGSGPRCGIFELMLPEIQPGSSIMPGKVNPVICESVIQVACRVIGNDAVVTTAGLGGIGSIFELNVAMPVMIDAFLESVTLLANVCNVFVDKLLTGLQVNKERCEALIEQSLMMVTSLAPVVGYDNAAKLAKQAFKENKTIRQLVTEQKLVEPKQLDELLNPDSMTRPGGSGGGGG